jgi:hypothetical protein
MNKVSYFKLILTSLKLLIIFIINKVFYIYKGPIKLNKNKSKNILNKII